MARLSRRTRRVLGLAAGAAAVGWAVREYALYRSDGLGEARAGTSRRGRRRRESQSSDVNARVGDEQNRPRLLRLERETDDADDAGDDLDLGSSIRGHRHGGGDSHVSTSSCAGSRRDSFDHGSDDLGCDDGTNTSTMSGPSLNDQSQHGNTSGTDSATPNFFASTKFFACLELEESQELFAASEEFDVPPNTVVFRQGDDSSSGIYIVVQGTLGVYLQENQTDDEDEDELIEDKDAGEVSDKKKKKHKKKGTSVRKSKAPLGPPFLTNILREGESVGDIDVLDNAPRGVSCITREDGARLVRVTQATLMEFIRAHPHTLETYVTQAVARLWRVAHFVLVDFLGLPRGPPGGDAVCLSEAPATHRHSRTPRHSRNGSNGDPNPNPNSRAPPASLLLRYLPDITACCPKVEVSDDGAIHREGDAADDFLLVLKGTCRADAVPWPKGNGARGPPARAPVLIGASAFLTRSARQETLRVSLDDDDDDEGSEIIRAPGDNAKNDENDHRSVGGARDCVVYSIGARELAALKERSSEAFIATVLAASCSLSPLLRRFISLGLNRVWLSAGEAAYLQGEEATSMYVLISGRIRLLQDKEKERVGNGQSTFGRGGGGAQYEERGRGETIGEAPLLAGGRYPSTAMCLRDSELVRMSRGALTLVCARNPVAASRLLEAMARKLHATLKGARARPDMVTICLVPATGAGDAAATATLARDLRRALRGFGPTLWLDEQAARGVFHDDTVGKLQSKFYRSKMTGWMAQQEENYRFILLQADATSSPWSQVCVSQADKILVVARASNPDPNPRAHEQKLLWRRRRGAATELVLVHDAGEAPRNLARFRTKRPDVARHHPLRLEAEEDLQRLARHIAGHAVGVVLTGGGGHGLAHLGALRALEDSGVPIDCVGGTSQGALMAALYARHASTTHMLPRVKELVGVLSSPRHLLTDLTLPVLSIFSGKGVDRILRTVLGDTDIEDLWLSFFCVSTNLTSGGLSTHTSGTVWRYVRASMTILGMLPPVRDEHTGDLLVDGGYLNAIPVDVLRERMGVETVVVVDVEDNDYIAFRNLTPHDGGLGGWRLLWERINPFGSWLGKWFLGPSIDEGSNPAGATGGVVTSDGTPTAPTRGNTNPSYGSLLNALTYATSSRHLAQARREHRVNLYLRPPGVSGWVAPLTPTRVDALVRRAHRYASGAIADWQRAASAERVADQRVAALEARDAAERHGAFQLGSPMRSSGGTTGVNTAAHSERESTDDLVRAGCKPPRDGTPETPETPRAVATSLLSEGLLSEASSSGNALSVRTLGAGGDTARSPRVSHGRQTPRRISATLPPQPPGHRGLPPRESGRDWSEAEKERKSVASLRSHASLSSSSYDTAGSTGAVGSLGSSFASLRDHHDDVGHVSDTVYDNQTTRPGGGGLGAGSALAALQDAIASGRIDPPVPTAASRRPRRRSEPEPLHMQSLLFATMRPGNLISEAAEERDGDASTPVDAINDTAQAPRRRSEDEQEFATRRGIPPVDIKPRRTVRTNTNRGVPVMNQLVDRRANDVNRWGEWLSGPHHHAGPKLFDSFPDDLPSTSPRSSGEWRRRRSFSAGDMELRAAAMAAVKSVREDQARSQVHSPVA